MKTKDIIEKIKKIRIESFIEGFYMFKDFNKFDTFIKNCLKDCNDKLTNDENFLLKDFKKFDLNKTLLENYKTIISEKMKPQEVDLNMAKMFAYNLDNEIVKGTIKCDNFCFQKIKEELIENELFEDVERLNNIKYK